MSVETSTTTAEDFAFQNASLQEVSRTFALTIPQLPEELCDVVGNAYLLCRIADTIEDEPALSATQKEHFSERFIAVVAGNEQAESFAEDLHALLSSTSSKSEHELIINTPRVIRITSSFSSVQRNAMARCVEVMSRGMSTFQKSATIDGLQNLSQLDLYCYYVAGVVGEMLTELFCDYSNEIDQHRDTLFELAVSFGQGLQMTNILKDFWDDRQRGACWFPRDVFSAFGCDLSTLNKEQSHPGFAPGLCELVGIARHHLENALRYVLIIPPRESGIRRHCLWALGMAVLTLRRIYATPQFKDGDEVKISRRSVWAVATVTSFLVRSDRSLRFLFNLLTRRLPRTDTSVYLDAKI